MRILGRIPESEAVHPRRGGECERPHVSADAGASGITCRAHDLLRIPRAACLMSDEPLPAWAKSAIARAPWVVVRRAGLRDGLIPVGIRGNTRAQRHAAWLASADVIEMRTPESLGSEAAWLLLDSDCGVARNVLESLCRAFTQLGLEHWGPTGSAGFELASGVPTLTGTSDLDVIVRLDRLPDVAIARAWLAGLDACNPRIDCLIELPAGAVALREFVQSPEALILRTLAGPQPLYLSAGYLSIGA